MSPLSTICLQRAMPGYVVDSLRVPAGLLWENTLLKGLHWLPVADRILPDGPSQMRGVRVMQPRRLWPSSTVRAHMYLAALPLHPPLHCLV